jgi:hypothetical protein
LPQPFHVLAKKGGTTMSIGNVILIVIDFPDLISFPIVCLDNPVIPIHTSLLCVTFQLSKTKEKPLAFCAGLLYYIIRKEASQCQNYQR